MGLLHQALGELPDAYTCFRRAISLRSDYPTARWNFALLQLLLGEYGEGFTNFEQRLLRSDAVPQRHTDLPRWQGEDISGKTLLVVAEQGYGDTIQFCRYLPLLIRLGITVAVEVQDQSLVSLIATIPGIGTVFHRTEQRPAADVQVPLLSLPFLCKTTTTTIPPATYLVPAQQQQEQWRNFTASGKTFRVGIVWRGRPKPDPGRSVPVDQLEPLLTIPGISWFSLQVEEVAHAETPAAIRNSHCGKLVNFSATAAFISTLDLVLTIDSAVAHLSGALGIMTWVMLPCAADWRWGLEHNSTPWYPAMTLFRQKRPQEWQTVLARVAQQLAAVMSTKP
jgi:hypothetical protein